jgi:hypothetical protein
MSLFVIGFCYIAPSQSTKQACKLVAGTRANDRIERKGCRP